MIGCLAALIIWLVSYLAIAAVGWAFVCGIVWLITLCFGLTFSWPIATGVWLIMVLITAVWPSSNK